MFEIWTASHFGAGDSEAHLKVLQDTLLSELRFPEVSKIRLSLSGCSDNYCEKLYRLAGDRLVIYHHEFPKSQFDHLRFILTTFINEGGDPRTNVMFIDDDDLLLKNLQD